MPVQLPEAGYGAVVDVDDIVALEVLELVMVTNVKRLEGAAVGTGEQEELGEHGGARVVIAKDQDLGLRRWRAASHHQPQRKPLVTKTSSSGGCLEVDQLPLQTCWSLKAGCAIGAQTLT